MKQQTIYNLNGEPEYRLVPIIKKHKISQNLAPSPRFFKSEKRSVLGKLNVGKSLLSLKFS